MARGDFYDSLFGKVYSAYMPRPSLGRPIAALVWGGDSKRYYDSMEAIAATPAGGTIVDCPCGAGPTLRWLDPAAAVRYVAVDLSPSMLRRFRSNAAKRGLEQVEPIETGATALPLEPMSVDLFLSFWGMHCFADPHAAVTEIGRVLRPGGRLVGAAFVKESKGLRQRFLLRPHTGDFGRMCSEAELLDWLREAGIAIVESSRSGPMFFFDACLEYSGSR
jgi:ubiquinone/menaquinone biosynthesis C-methylase UbiE